MIPRVWNLSARLNVGILILVPIFVLLGLVLLAPPDGSDRAALMQFVGRFHPLSVHLPIALLVLVPLLELVGRRQRFSYLLLSIDFLLGIATCGAIIAAALGWTLARSGGYSGPLVTQHMWAGVFVGVGACGCRSRASSAPPCRQSPRISRSLPAIVHYRNPGELDVSSCWIPRSISTCVPAESMETTPGTAIAIDERLVLHAK